MLLHLKGVLGAETEECIFEPTHTSLWKDTSDSLVFGESVLLFTEKKVVAWLFGLLVTLQRWSVF